MTGISQEQGCFNALFLISGERCSNADVMGLSPHRPVMLHYDRFILASFCLKSAVTAADWNVEQTRNLFF